MTKIMEMPKMAEKTERAAQGAKMGSGLGTGIKDGQLVLVMSSQIRFGFDFVGYYDAANSNEQITVLRSALTVRYPDPATDDSLATAKLGPLHVPYGLVNIKAGYALHIPNEGIGYMSELLDETDWMHEKFAKFWAGAGAVPPSPETR